MNKVKSRTRNFPLIIVVLYLVGTLLLYIIGPFEWVTYKPVLFWGLNIIYVVMFIAGWVCGGRISVSNNQWNVIDSRRTLGYLNWLISVNFIYEVINLFRKFHMSSFSVSILLTKIKEGILNMGASYNNFQANVDEVGANVLGGNIMTCFNILFAFFAFNILMLGTLYFKFLSKYNKIILIVTYILIATGYIATGTNIGVFRLLFVLVVFGGLKIAKGDQQKYVVSTKSKKRKFIIFVIVAIIICLILFSKIMQSRGGILYWKSESYNVGGVGIDKSSILFQLLPSSLHMLLVSASAYLTQGYYGMSLCLTVPWQPGYGVGSCMAFLDMFDSILMIPHQNSYQYRLSELGWNEGTQWHSMYSWFANDFTFIGVILIMFLIGFTFSLAYRDSILTNNPYAKLVTYYMCLMCFFIPCNNQLFQSTYTMFAFFLAIIFWLLTRGKRRISIRFRR